MIRPEGQPILTAAAMRAAEDRAVARGTSLATLMDRAGEGVAEAVRRLAAGAEALVLCGPGNNGGDGWVAAATLAAAGHRVRVAASGKPATDLARAARLRWTGPVQALDAATPAPVVVDALFGTGLARPIEASLANRLAALLGDAQLGIAVDLPSGLASDGGEVPSGFPVKADLTLALGALKPAHLLYPAADRCGTVRLLDIGLDLDEPDTPDLAIGHPVLPKPTSASHKYSRGFVIVVGGDMPGAAALAGEAALHAGAGYALLLGEPSPGMPHALVRRDWSADALGQAFAGKDLDRTAIVVGPGLGRGSEAGDRLQAALVTDCPLVIDGDALHLLDEDVFRRIKARRRPVVLTPHAGEFKAAFGDFAGSKIDAVRDAAERSGAAIVFKGPDTATAYPDGRTRTATRASFWLSTAGTGDVLAGTIAAMLAGGAPKPVEAAVWLHIEAAHAFGRPFLADELAATLSRVRGSR